MYLGGIESGYITNSATFNHLYHVEINALDTYYFNDSGMCSSNTIPEPSPFLYLLIAGFMYAFHAFRRIRRQKTTP